MENSKKALKSSMIKSGKRNFFFDIYLASNNKKYLKITESRVPEAEGEKGKRTSFVLFAEDIANWQSTMAQVGEYLHQ